MQIASKALEDGATLPKKYTELSCGGENVSPDLSWFGAPEGTRSYAITCYDPDAPTGSGWWHWIAFDIPTGETSVVEGGPVPGREWENDYGYVGYGGACPPPGHGPHRYIFTVHALDCETLGCGDAMTSAAVRFTLLSHSLDSATITVTYESAAENALAATVEDAPEALAGTPETAVVDVPDADAPGTVDGATRAER